MTVHSNTVAINTTVNYSGYMQIYSGGVANRTTVCGGASTYGYMYIENGGVASNTTVSSRGAMYISSGGVANSTTVDGDMYIENGGVASNTTVNYRGYMQVVSGGVANSTTMSGGSMCIHSGGVANSTTMSGGSMCIHSGGVASSTTMSGGSMSIYSGGVASSTTMSGGRMCISSGGVANSTTMSGGVMSISSGSVASNTTVSSGGYMYIKNGGVASNTTVSSGGSMSISSGGVHRGSLQMESGATVFAYRSAVIDFTIAGRTGTDGYLINDLSRLSGTPTYTITVSANQATGTYKLAQGASDFSGSVAIGDGTTSYGSITVNSADFVYGGKSYSLDQINGNLTLTVSAKDVTPPEKPVTSANITALTNKDVVVTATFSSDTAVKQYSLNNSTWSTYSGGVAMSANGTVYFRGLDAAGNISQVASYTVSNIDKTPPSAPTVKADVTAPTNGSVYLTATFSSDSSKKEYSLDNRTWQNYSGAVKVDANTTVYFRASDSVGNVSEVTRFVVSNIDTVAPTLEITGNATAPTNKDVVLSAKASDGVIEHFANGKWVAGDKLTVSENGTYTFRVTDEVGNITEKSVVVDQIDKVAPSLEITGNATVPTNQDVVLSAVVSDGTVEYFANGEWLAGDKLVVSENGEYQFRVTDEAGNVAEKTVVVDQIDKVAPTLEITGNANAPTNKDVTLTAVISDGTVEYFANGKWLAGNKLTVTENGTYQFRVTDEVGNITEKSVVVDQIDKVAPSLEITGNATAPTNKDVTLTAVVSDGTVEYFANGKWLAGDKLTVSKNGTYTFRVTDLAGNVTEKSVVVDQIDKFVPDVPLNAEPIFIKKSYSSKVNGKKQSGFVLKYLENAFRYIPIDVDCSDRKVILLDSKSVFHMSIEAENLDTIYGNLETVSSQTGSYKYSKSPKNQVDFVMGDNYHINLESFAKVNVTDGASIGNISGGKETVSQSEKKSLKNWVITETVKYSQTVTASGKVTVTNATAGNISGYSTVTLDNGVAGELVNSNVKISNSDKTVGGKDDTITHTTTYSASGTATLKNGSYVDSISGFKTVKLTASAVGEIALGDSYTEKFTLKKGVKTPSSKKTYTGTVTLENASVGSIVDMNKVTASKGFNAIASYTGSDGNDTLTINKNAVLALGAVDMGAGAKDKFVNNGTLVLTGDFDRSFISGKGEIVAASDVYEILSSTSGVLNLGATAEGFRTTKHENSDDAIKKAVKWDLKAGDYTGWLGSWQSGSDNVDFIKFTIGKNDVDKELCVSGVENFTLFDKKGNEVDIISAAGTYTLELKWDETDSHKYTLALA